MSRLSLKRRKTGSTFSTSSAVEALPSGGLFQTPLRAPGALSILSSSSLSPVIALSNWRSSTEEEISTTASSSIPTNPASIPATTTPSSSSFSSSQSSSFSSSSLSPSSASSLKQHEKPRQMFDVPLSVAQVLFEKPQVRNKAVNLNDGWAAAEDTLGLGDQELLRFQEEDEAQRLKKRDRDARMALERKRPGEGEGASQWKEKPRDQMTARDWRAFREAHQIMTQGVGVPAPVRSWAEAQLPAPVQSALNQAGYRSPTPVQMQAIPIGMRGLDLLASAETGSGKTAAFLVPMICYFLRHVDLDAFDARHGPLGLVMAPTRELAAQIHVEACKFSQMTRLRFELVYGGVPLREQVTSLQRAPYHVLIATPGRLIDLLQQEYVVLNQCISLVLDEADRMVDFGFEPQLKQVLDSLPKTSGCGAPIHRFFSMFSATFPPQIVSMARTYLKTPIRVSIGRAGKAVSRIEQRVVWIHDPKTKMPALKKVIQQGPPPLIIVFAATKITVDEICRFLDRNGFPSVAIHAGKSQEAREAAIERFRAGEFKVLVATDVAGRGIDIPDVNHVVQYDIGRDISDYTHRIGRTGRAGNSGVATSFITDADTSIMYELAKTGKEANVRLPRELLDHPASNIPYDVYLRNNSVMQQ
ncbi:MAG: DEAD/DEAH box helicase [archaeon]|nr:DEAD/DEAH box helicase [archaeon]